VVVALEGSGKLVLEGGPERFQAPCTVVLPAGATHRIVNNAATPLQLVCVHGAALPPEDA
jgi:mannose-6-phosphate isomerase-like protein (cupin superfamily)